MPNLRHVAELVSGKLHHIDVIRARLFAGRLTWTAGASMRTREDTVGSDVVSLGISGKGFHLIATVGHNRHQSLHPIGVFRKCFDICERFGFCGECCIRSAVSLAGFPPLSSLTTAKKLLAIAVIDAMTAFPVGSY